MNIVSNGSQTANTASGGTKHQLYTTTLAGTYALLVDTQNQALGDTLELYVDVGCASGDSHQQALYVVYAHNQADPVKTSIPVIAPYGATFSLKQSTGTGRAFKWAVVAL